MLIPWRWQSLEEDWYWVKLQNFPNKWIEVRDGCNDNCNTYKQVDLSSDVRGSPEVYLLKVGDDIGIKLTENMSCFWHKGLKCSQNQIKKGFWTRKFGN